MSTSNTLAWVGAALIGAVVLTPNFSGDDAPAEATDAGGKPVNKRAGGATTTAGNGFATRELRRDPDGHFYADALVNGARVRFMIDTGASMVALTAADAQRAGIARGDARGRAIGVGGEIEIMPVTVDRIAIGPLEARDVRGAVIDELGVSLLGQSFLEQVGSVEIRGDTMVLR